MINWDSLNNPIKIDPGQSINISEETKTLLTESFNISTFYNELKEELEREQDGFFMITPSNDKETLDAAYQKFNAQNDEQKKKADIRSVALYGMNNYSHYHMLLAKNKKGTKDDELNGFEYNRHDGEVVKEGSIYYFSRTRDGLELEHNIDKAKEFNANTMGRVIIYPTNDANELESLYMKYMALGKDDRAASDNKTYEMFGFTNRQIYQIIKDKVIKPENDEIEDTHSVEDKDAEKEAKKSSIFTNDLPLLTPKEMNEKIHEDYSCLTREEAKILSYWREAYSLLGMGIKVPEYNEYNKSRLNILRNAIYENNTDLIIQCGWIPGVEFNLENRALASNIVREKIRYGYRSNFVFCDESYLLEPLNESLIFNKNDLYYNFEKFENGKSNILLITGLSGSGKSTLAEQLSSKYKAEYIELDLFEHVNMFENDDQLKEAGMVFYDYLSKHKDIWDKLKNKKLTGKAFGDTMYDFLKYCITWCKRHKDQKFIIEGIQIYEVYKEEAKSYPIIVKGSSVFRSAYQRMIKRENMSFKEVIKDAPDLMKWLIYSDKHLNYLKKSLNESYMEESKNEDKKAVSIILIEGNSLIGKTIRGVTRSEFSHASISLDDDLDRIYSYNTKKGFNGFMYESIQQYIQEGVKKIGVYTFLVSDNVYKSIENVINNLALYINKTRYSVLNLFTIPINIPLDLDMKMVCSEFVDKLLKTANIDLTGKKSSLVSPKDISKSISARTNIVEVFNGNPKDFDKKAISNKIKKIKNSNLPIYEFTDYTQSINEVKEFPVQFDDDGNLFINNLKSINFDNEYNASHRFLMIYEKAGNLEGMKYELAKLFSLNKMLEHRIYNSKFHKKDREKYINIRARVLNDFNKYLEIVVQKDKRFNFAAYYDKTPFSDAVIKINSGTLNTGARILKSLL